MNKGVNMGTGKVMKRMILALLLVSGLASCSVQDQMNAKFGDQHFKTAIALIELYHLRNGVYPESLKALTFTGDWDPIALQSVHYERLDNGYELDIVNGWVGQPKLSYPPEFWKNLGLVKTNVGGRS
jgi:hypothetical protein